MSYVTPSMGEAVTTQAGAATVPVRGSAPAPGLPFVDAALLHGALTTQEAVDALASAFAAMEAKGMPARQHLDVPDGELLLMPAFGPSGVGVKLITIAPDNPARDLPLIHGVYVLFAAGAPRPQAAFGRAPPPAGRARGGL